jgi:hypothetical protein
MKKLTLLITTICALGAWSIEAADETTAQERRQRAAQRDKADINQLIRDVNRLDNSPAGMRNGMAAVSKETAVPLARIEATHKQYPNVGLGGLFMAHEIATKTTKSADDLLKQHAGGKTWSELAVAEKVDLNVIENKLARIQDAITTGGDRSQVRERGDRLERNDRLDRRATRSGLERRIDSVNALDDTAAAKRAGLTAMSKETAVPLPTVEEADKNNANAGLGDLFVAQELATKTQKSVSELLGMHRDGKTWAEIAASHNQDINSVEQKLARVEEAMRSAIR